MYKSLYIKYETTGMTSFLLKGSLLKNYHHQYIYRGQKLLQKLIQRLNEYTEESKLPGVEASRY